MTADDRAFGMPRFLDAGDGALVVEFGSSIDAELNQRVLALDAALTAAALRGVHECVPTYRSLLVAFDPVVIRRAALREAILEILERKEVGVPPDRRGWVVPVLYGGAAGEDLEDLAASHALSAEEVVALHSAARYRVYMIGFSPGFSYLGGLPEALHTSRRTTPRMRTPPRSISIGGAQTAVSPPLELPSGWHLIGQTPVRSYDPVRETRTFLFRSGDVIRFRPVRPNEYDRLCAAAEAGDLVAERCDP